MQAAGLFKYVWPFSGHHALKGYNNKYVIASTQIGNNEIFAFLAVLVFKLLNHKVLLINREENRNYYKVGYFLRKQQISWGN